MSHLSTTWRSRVDAHLSRYRPRPAAGVRPERLILTRGARATRARRAFARRLAALYPHAEVVEAEGRTHMQLQGLLPGGHDAARRRAGRRSLVLGTIGTPLRRSRESGIVCPSYLHLSPTALCSFACAYCYLAGSCSTVVAPAPKIYVNQEDVLDAVARRARRLGRPTSVYVGKLQDALGLDPLTGFSRLLVPFFARQPHARLVMLTKSDAVENLLDLAHRGHTVVSWSVNPPGVCRDFERGAPSLRRRFRAARRCAAAGYPIRFLLMPMLPVPGWPEQYDRLVEELFAAVAPQRITLGGICSYRGALRLTDRALGRDSLLRAHLAEAPSPDGRFRFPRELRVRLYRHVLAAIRRRAPEQSVALCLEEPEVRAACGLDPAAARCNCVW